MLFNWLHDWFVFITNQCCVSIAIRTRQGQVWLAILSYFSYAQLFIIVSLDSLWPIIMDKSSFTVKEQHGLKLNVLQNRSVYENKIL